MSPFILLLVEWIIIAWIALGGKSLYGPNTPQLFRVLIHRTWVAQPFLPVLSQCRRVERFETRAAWRVLLYHQLISMPHSARSRCVRLACRGFMPISIRSLCARPTWRLSTPLRTEEKKYSEANPRQTDTASWTHLLQITHVARRGDAKLPDAIRQQPKLLA